MTKPPTSPPPPTHRKHLVFKMCQKCLGKGAVFFTEGDREGYRECPHCDGKGGSFRSVALHQDQ